MDIDFVVTWVDGSDRKWQKEKARCAGKPFVDDRDVRYRDWDQMVYWFRGVERFAPWVRKIHFVTCGQIPPWLNTKHPKLHLVDHKDYIPAEFLPTFNADTIELHFHRIEGLAEHFVDFNDDVFCIAPLEPDDFFHNGLPRDMLALQPIIANPDSPQMSYLYLNNSMLLARHFTKRENVRKQPWAYFKPGYPPLYFFYNFLELAFPRFTGFYTTHGPSPFLKQSFEEVWAAEGDYLHEALMGKFRDREHVTQYAIREWQKLSGNFVPTNMHKDFRYFNVETENPKLVRTISRQEKKIICINDANHAIDFERAKAEINGAFENILSEKSSFEL